MNRQQNREERCPIALILSWRILRVCHTSNGPRIFIGFAPLLAQTEILMISDGTVTDVAQKPINAKVAVNAMRRTERACTCPALEHAA